MSLTALLKSVRRRGSRRREPAPVPEPPPPLPIDSPPPATPRPRRTRTIINKISTLSFTSTFSKTEKPQLIQRLNPLQFFGNRDGSAQTTQFKGKELARDAGVIYGTRTYDWGTPAPSSPITPAFSAAPEQRRNTIRRFLHASKTILKSKSTPALPSLSKQKSFLARSPTKTAQPDEGPETLLSDTLPADSSTPDALGISIAQPVERSETSATKKTGISTDTRSRFSFDSSVAGADSLLRNDSNSSKATHISMGDLPDGETESDERELEVVVPFQTKLYSTADLAEITAFDFSDDTYGGDDDDMLIDEVNGYATDDFSDSDQSDYDGPDGPATLTPISERMDEERGSPVFSSSLHANSSPVSARSREVVAYVRGSRGWVVERRVRKDRWGYRTSEGDDDSSDEVEEQLVGTERVERRAI